MESLAQIYTRHSTEGDVGHADKGSIHSYIDSYETILAPYRERCSFCEIGVAHGKSMDMWGEYFGPESRITGIDISIGFDRARFDERFDLIEADATKPEIMRLIAGKTFDVVIDDGSHLQGDQEATFLLLSPLMNPGGIYVIEDILNIEWSGDSLRALHPNCETIDLRHVKGRFDDVLLVYRF